MAIKNLIKHISTVVTPQMAAIPGREADQVRNLAGGYTFAVDIWTGLDRFLILGTDGGAYYASERALTVAAAAAVRACLAVDGVRTVARIVEISVSGRAPKNDPALIALAIAAKEGDDVTRRAAYAALPDVARTGTHLFGFADAVQTLGGWGRGSRTAIAKWYSARDDAGLAYQLVKYRQRDGWTHADLLRLAHVRPTSAERSAAFRWVVKNDIPPAGAGLPLIAAFIELQDAETAARAAELIREYRLPREAVPTHLLKDRLVWEALLEHMPMTALIRNLATLTRVGLLAPGSVGVTRVVAQLTDQVRIEHARVHPMSILVALRTYAAGRGVRGQKTWEPVQAVVDALDAAFYAAFGNVVPTGRRTLVAIDCSGSMTMGNVAGIPGFNAREAAAAMALITLRTEPNAEVIGFTTGYRPLRISARQRLDDVLYAVDRVAKPEGTDCAVPMAWALEHKRDVDAFLVYTDGQTWAGAQHPVQAMAAYRKARVADARMVSVAFVGYGDSIVDGSDAGMLDVVGFDTAVPALIRDFIAREA